MGVTDRGAAGDGGESAVVVVAVAVGSMSRDAGGATFGDGPTSAADVDDACK